MNECLCNICLKNKRGVKTKNVCNLKHLVQKMSKQIADEIDADILRDLYEMSKVNGNL